jgi:hypothetical protein
MVDVELKVLRISALVLFLGLASSMAYAQWGGSQGLAPDYNTEVPINLGVATQTKEGSLNFDKMSVSGAALLAQPAGVGSGSLTFQYGVGVGRTPGIAGGLDVGDKISSGSLCLGDTPSPYGCISRWQDLDSIVPPSSVGIVGRLVKWSGDTTITNSSVSEDGSRVLFGKPVSFNGLSMPNMAGRVIGTTNKALSVDANGNVVLIDLRSACGAVGPSMY